MPDLAGAQLTAASPDTELVAGPWPADRSFERWHGRDQDRPAASRAGSAEVCLGGYLRDLCEHLAGTHGSANGPKLICMASDTAPLPLAAAITLGLIADKLIVDSFVHGFPLWRGGRIVVFFSLRPDAWELIVEDSGVTPAAGSRHDDDLNVMRLLIARLGGLLDTPRVIGGNRYVATVPHPTARSWTPHSHPVTLRR